MFILLHDHLHWCLVSLLLSLFVVLFIYLYHIDCIFTNFYWIYGIFIIYNEKTSYEKFLSEKGKKIKSTYSRSILLIIRLLGSNTIQKKVIIIKVLMGKTFYLEK